VSFTTSWKERKAKYSQAKIELYGVCRCLRALRIYLVGLPAFNVEVDAKYIKESINNPDIQPNNAMDRWIYQESGYGGLFTCLAHRIAIEQYVDQKSE